MAELGTQTEMQILMRERDCAGSSWSHHDQFDKDGYFVVEDFWDPEELYHPVPESRGQFTYWDTNPDHYDYAPVETQVEGSLARYWHPQYRKIHTSIRKKIEKLIGRKLYNTYYYDRYYFPGQALTKHVDRDACEISVSVHVSTNLPDDLKDWPIVIKTPDTYTDKKKSAILVPGEERSVVLNPGDGIIYKGCERPHWRDPMPTPKRRKRDKFLHWVNDGLAVPQNYYYHQLFLHYVLQDGERAHTAGDRGN